MNFTEVVFLIQFIIVLIIALAKLLNISRKGELWDIPLSVVLLIAFCFAWGVGLLTTIYTIDTFYVILFKLEAWLLPLVIILFFAEIIFKINFTQDAQPYYSNRN